MKVTGSVVNNEVRAGAGKGAAYWVPPSGTSLIFGADGLWGEWVWRSVGRQGPGSQGWLRLPFRKTVKWVGCPPSFLSDQLVALSLQVVVSLLSSSSPQRVRWMVTVQTSGPGPGAPPGLGGSRPQGTRPDPSTPCVFSRAQPPLLKSRSRTVEGYVPSLASQQVLAYLGCVALGPKVTGVSRGIREDPCGGAYEQPLRGHRERISHRPGAERILSISLVWAFCLF